MQRVLWRRRLAGLALAGLVVVGGLLARPQAARTADANEQPSKAALTRARREVQMLDNMAKSMVVHVTATYVKARETTPAAHIAKKVFHDMKDKGFFTARLIDVTGEPFNKVNVAKSAWEKRAVAALKGGKTYWDEVGEVKGKPVLHAATIVPAVTAACVVCHPNVKEGQLLGAITYEVPIR